MYRHIILLECKNLDMPKKILKIIIIKNVVLQGYPFRSNIYTYNFQDNFAIRNLLHLRDVDFSHISASDYF